MKHKKNKNTQGCTTSLHASLAEVRVLLRAANTLELSHDAKQRLRWFEYALDHEGNVSLTCRYFGIARSTFVRWAKRFDADDVSTLEEHSRRPRHVRQPETDADVINHIRRYRQLFPTLGKQHIKNKLRDDYDINVSVSTVGRVIHRHGFFFADTNAHKQKRKNAEKINDASMSDVQKTQEEHHVVQELVCGFIEAAHTVLSETAALSDADLLTPTTKVIPPDRSLPDNDDERSAGQSGATLVCTLLILGASAFGGFFTSIQSAHAAESASFKLYDEFPNYSERHQRSSANFTMNEDGMTWESKPLASTSFQIVTAPPVSATSDDGGDDGGDGGGGGTSGGRRPCPHEGVFGPCPDYIPPTPEPEPQPGPQPEPPSPIQPPVKVLPPRHAPPVEVAHLAAPKIDLPQVTFLDIVDTQCPTCPVCNQSVEETVHAAAPNTWFGSLQWLFFFILGLIAGTLFVLLFASTRRMLGEKGVDGDIFMLPLIGFFGSSNEEEFSCAWPKRDKNTLIRRGVFTIFIVLLALFSFWGATRAFAATTVPLKHVYNGHLLDSAGAAVTTAHTVRFSYWSSADYVSGDITGTGAIHEAAATYQNWYEEHTVTPDSNGYFSVQMGSVTALPDIASMATDFFLQVEVKASAAADTSYELLDVNGSDASVDRSPVLSVQFALNADKLDLRNIGTSSGSIPLLQTGGLLPVSTIPGGTTQSGFIIDTDGSELGDITLTFGGSINKTLSYDQSSNYFDFNDDVNIQGDLTISGLINGVDISTLISTATGALKVSSGAGLNASIAGGSYRISGNLTNFAGDSTVALTNNTTNYVYFSSTGTQVNTSGLPTNISMIPLAEVVTSGGGVSQVRDRRALSTDDRERTIELNYHAEFQNASYQGDASNNTGQLHTNHDGVSDRNFYQWSSSSSTLQDYDIILRATLPKDFVRWVNAQKDRNPLRISYRTTSADSSNNQLDVSVLDTNGTPVSLSGSSLSSGQDLVGTGWATEQIEFTGSPTWTAGQSFEIRLKVHARNNFQMHVGDLTLEYVELPSE